jgi:hypothetical protein
MKAPSAKVTFPVGTARLGASATTVAVTRTDSCNRGAMSVATRVVVDDAGDTVPVVALDVDGSTVGDARYEAVNDTGPIGSFTVVRDAVPPTSTTVPSGVRPFLKRTLPVTAALEVTCAVRVTGCPDTLTGASTDNAVDDVALVTAPAGGAAAGSTAATSPINAPTSNNRPRKYVMMRTPSPKVPPGTTQDEFGDET